MRVGIIGLGIMGSAIAANVMRGGFKASGFDVDPAALARFTDQGGTAATSAGLSGHDCAVVLTSLPSTEALDRTVTALEAEGSAGLIVAELSTLPLETKLRAAERLAARGIDLLDCPLSGTGAQAATGDIAIYASGNRAAYDRCADVFAAFSRSRHYLGELGNGMRMKIVANLLVAIHNVATAEALALAEQSGLDLRRTVEVLSSGAGNSKILELRGPMMAEGRFTPPTMKLDVWRKDMDIIGGFAQSLGVETPLFSATEAIYEAARAQGRGGEDTAAVFAVLQGAKR